MNTPSSLQCHPSLSVLFLPTPGSQVTLNHVGAIRDCINDPAVIELVDSCEHMLNLHYKSFMPGDWMQLRQSLVGFFHNKRVKVSLFLQEGLQVPHPESHKSAGGERERGGSR